ncbi:hypothetical protein LJC33_05770 [Eubacteriales bacterium OttesenSCG-928-N13]|nr:hypothetical protein [Eubacteriales bacterium OttesenSCG-928-N13]
MLVGKHLLVFDAGASLRELGRASDILNNAQQLHLFLSHFHPTHIEGLPFFAPLFEAGRDVRIYARRTSSESAADTLNRHFSPPHFPIAFMGEQKVSNVSIVDLEPPGRIELDDATAIEYLHEPDPESGIAFHITLGAF